MQQAHIREMQNKSLSQNLTPIHLTPIQMKPHPKPAATVDRNIMAGGNLSERETVPLIISNVLNAGLCIIMHQCVVPHNSELNTPKTDPQPMMLYAMTTQQKTAPSRMTQQKTAASLMAACSMSSYQLVKV